MSHLSNGAPTGVHRENSMSEGVREALQTKPSERVHVNISCRHCNINSIIGTRYRCSTCPEFDLCSDCMDNVETAKIHSPHHLFYRVPIQFPDNEIPPCIQIRSHWTHDVSCSLCGDNITGFRFICAQCGTSFCSLCDQRGLHPQSHNVLRLLPQTLNPQSQRRPAPMPSPYASLIPGGVIPLAHIQPQPVAAPWATWSRMIDAGARSAPMALSNSLISTDKTNGNGMQQKMQQLHQHQHQLHQQQQFQQIQQQQLHIQQQQMRSSVPLSVPDMVAGINFFADNLTSKLRGMGINSSFFLSPFALGMSLLLLANSVRASPRAEILQALNLARFDMDQLNDQARSSMQAFLNAKMISVSNAVWTSKFPITVPYKSICMDKYFAAAYTCSSTDTVNSWCRTTSQGYLERVFEETAPLPHLAVVSAVSLCTSWSHPFDPSRTRKQPFHRTSMMTGTCDMMVTEGRFRYISTDTYEAIQLPYRSNGSGKGGPANQLSAIVILTKVGFNLNISALPEWSVVFKTLTNTPAVYGTLYLPRFSTETRFPNLIPELNVLGVLKVFKNESSADFLSMVQSQDVERGSVGQRVEEIVHAVHVSATEKGAEKKYIAGRGDEAAIPPQHSASHVDEIMFTMTCDKPFQFNVCDEAGLRLFMGEVKNPRMNAVTVQARAATPAPAESKKRPRGSGTSEGKGGRGRGSGGSLIGGGSGSGSGSGDNTGHRGQDAGKGGSSKHRRPRPVEAPAVVAFNSQGLPTFSASGVSSAPEIADHDPPPPPSNIPRFPPSSNFSPQVYPGMSGPNPSMFPPTPPIPRFNSEGQLMMEGDSVGAGLLGPGRGAGAGAGPVEDASRGLPVFSAHGLLSEGGAHYFPPPPAASANFASYLQERHPERLSVELGGSSGSGKNVEFGGAGGGVGGIPRSVGGVIGWDGASGAGADIPMSQQSRQLLQSIDTLLQQPQQPPAPYLTSVLGSVTDLNLAGDHAGGVAAGALAGDDGSSEGEGGTASRSPSSSTTTVSSTSSSSSIVSPLELGGGSPSAGPGPGPGGATAAAQSQSSLTARVSSSSSSNEGGEEDVVVVAPMGSEEVHRLLQQQQQTHEAGEAATQQTQEEAHSEVIPKPN